MHCAPFLCYCLHMCLTTNHYAPRLSACGLSSFFYAAFSQLSLLLFLEDWGQQLKTASRCQIKFKCDVGSLFRIKEAKNPSPGKPQMGLYNGAQES